LVAIPLLPLPTVIVEIFASNEDVNDPVMIAFPLTSNLAFGDILFIPTFPLSNILPVVKVVAALNFAT
jgi:hypothetical protein